MKGVVAKRMQMLHPSGIRKMISLARKMEDVIFLITGDPDFETPEYIKEAGKEAIQKGITHYTPTLGITELREAISLKLKEENGIEADPNSEIFVTVGASGAIYTAIQTLINPSDRVIITDPDFLTYSECVKLAGGVPISLPLREENEFNIEPRVLSKLVTPKTKMIIFSNPNNPTGSVMSKETLEEVAEIAREKKILVMADEVYEKLVYDGIRHSSIASLPRMKDQTLSVYSFSKTYAMTGWRIGYVTANKEIIEQMGKISAYTSGAPSSISQIAALSALTGDQKCVEDMVKEYNRRRNLLMREITSIKGFKTPLPKGAFYLFPNIKSFKMSDEEFAERLLLNARVATVPGSTFGRHGEGYIRISYCYSEETLCEGIKRIRDYVDTFT